MGTKGDTRSLDYGSYDGFKFLVLLWYRVAQLKLQTNEAQYTG